MGTVLVTVAWGSRRRDLAVPADVAVADLLRPLLAALADGPPPPRPNDLGPGPADGPAHGRPGGSGGSGGSGHGGSGGGHGGHGGGGEHGLALAPLCGEPLRVDRSLEACRIVHGAVLVLIDARLGAQWPSQGG